MPYVHATYLCGDAFLPATDVALARPPAGRTTRYWPSRETSISSIAPSMRASLRSVQPPDALVSAIASGVSSGVDGSTGMRRVASVCKVAPSGLTAKTSPAGANTAGRGGAALASLAIRTVGAGRASAPSGRRKVAPSGPVTVIAGDACGELAGVAGGGAAPPAPPVSSSPLPPQAANANAQAAISASAARRVQPRRPNVPAPIAIVASSGAIAPAKRLSRGSRYEVVTPPEGRHDWRRLRHVLLERTIVCHTPAEARGPGGDRRLACAVVGAAPRATRAVAEGLRRPWRSNLVAKGGIEPPTRGFSIRCSTN